MRTVASLTLEDERVDEYNKALDREDPHPVRTNLVKGSASGLGQFMQFWAFALMFWVRVAVAVTFYRHGWQVSLYSHLLAHFVLQWGGWLMTNYSDVFSYLGYLISMFALFFSMYGLTLAAQGAVDREKAKLAAHRIFALTDRKSLIDPLRDEGLHGSAMLYDKELQYKEVKKEQQEAEEIIFHEDIFSMEAADEWAGQIWERSTETSSDHPSDETHAGPSDEEESEFEMDPERDPLA